MFKTIKSEKMLVCFGHLNFEDSYIVSDFEIRISNFQLFRYPNDFVKSFPYREVKQN